MIRVVLQHDGYGCLSRVRMEGHAGGGPVGDNPVCAAATVLARTAARLLDAASGIEVHGEADHEGMLEVVVTAYEPETLNYLKGASDYLLVGLRDLEREYPNHVAVLAEDLVETEGE
ncbi:MAG: ribosomal-processing cysteine protease Prp [Spirochaetota bacterium]